MKLLKRDSGLAARKQLAQELGYSGALDGSAEMNVWLHKQVMTNYKAPPDERGGNGYVQPTATATHLDSTQPAHRRHRRCPDPGSRVTGIGPQAGYLFPVGGLQGYLNLKGLLGFRRAEPRRWLERVADFLNLAGRAERAATAIRIEPTDRSRVVRRPGGVSRLDPNNSPHLFDSGGGLAGLGERCSSAATVVVASSIRACW